MQKGWEQELRLLYVIFFQIRPTPTYRKERRIQVNTDSATTYFKPKQRGAKSEN